MAGVNMGATLGTMMEQKRKELGYMRKPPLAQMRSWRSHRDRVAMEHAPEVHFIGEIVGGFNFGSGVACKFHVQAGKHWTLLEGEDAGQTHVVHASGVDDLGAWNHPIDLHYTTKSIQGWPRIMVEIWQLDEHGRNILQGYGFGHLPSTCGTAQVKISCWRPVGSMRDEIASYFLGVNPELSSTEVLFNKAWEQRCRLVTIPSGDVIIQLTMLARNFGAHNVDV